MGRQLFKAMLLVAAVLTLLAPQKANAGQTPRLTRQHTTGSCEGGGFVISSSWRLYVPGAPGTDAHDVASLLAQGEFLMGCEDEYPPPSLGVESAPGGPGACFGQFSCLTDLATNLAPTVSLATRDAVSSTARADLSTMYGFPMDWWDNLDDPEDAQGYLLAYVEADYGAGQGPKVLIVGATRDGLQYGVVDWLKSIDRVRVASTGFEWSPDPKGPYAVPGGPLVGECNSYGTTGCLAGEVCWNLGSASWELIDEIEWCPEQALNYPDVTTRMAYPAFGGGSAAFIPNVLSRVYSNAGSTCDAGPPVVTEADWWQENVLACDRNGEVTWGVSGADTPCQKARVRLDGLVWGKYTHAIDEQYAVWASPRLESDTQCDSALLYEEVWQYLRQRRVLMVPSAFGLEARTQEEPIGGTHRDDGTTWKASEWGQYGNFRHSEGLAVHDREFTVCEDGAGQRFLSPEPGPGTHDAAAGLVACTDYFDPATGAAVGDVARATPTIDFDAFSLGDPSSADIQVTDPASTPCWLPLPGGIGGGTDPRGEPSPTTGDSCDLLIDFPLNSDTENRLYAVTFQAMVDVGGLSGELLVTPTTGEPQRMHVEIRETVTTTTGYHDSTTSGHLTSEWVNFSLVVRVPPEDTDNNGVADIASFTLTLTGTHDGTDALVWLDDIQVLELDGMLRNVDAGSVVYTDQWGDEIDPNCFELLEDAVGGTSLPEHWEDTTGVPDTELGWHPILDSGGVVTDYVARVQVTQPWCTTSTAGVWTGWDPSDPTVPSDPLWVSYRTWTHAGLWPKVAQTQQHYVYGPNVFDLDYWSDRFSPASQMQALATNNGHGEFAVDEDKRDRFILVSDLGGEVRGFNRAGYVEGASNGEKLSSYYCRLRRSVCDAFTTGMGGCGGTPACSSMFLPLSDPGWAPCDCSSSFLPFAGPDLLIAADMFALGHNGGYDFYQVPYGGYAGRTMEALATMPPNTTFLAWWHLDSHRGGGTDLVGQEMAAGIVEELAMYGFDSIGGPAWDTDTQRMWGAYAAAGERTSNAAVKGIAHYGWGTDIEGSEYMAQTGQYAWQPEWQFIHHWSLSNQVDNPGGLDTPQWSSSGMSLVDDEVVRPAAGQSLRVTGGSGTWASSLILHPLLDVEQLGAEFYGMGTIPETWWTAWDPSDQLLLRFYTKDYEPGCRIDVDFTLDSDHALSPMMVSTQAGPPGSWSDYRAMSARAALPTMYLSAEDLSGLEVDVYVTFDDCQDLQFDSVALYQGLSFIDFPYAYEEKNIQNVWTNGDGNDARMMICGSTSDPSCINANTFDAR